jgi:hypothetical protein
MAKGLTTRHRIECAVIAPLDCIEESFVLGGDVSDAMRVFRDEGWRIRDQVWLCPSCVQAFDNGHR